MNKLAPIKLALIIAAGIMLGSACTKDEVTPPEKYADFILIDKDVLNCPAEELHETKVLKTFFEGRCVYDSNTN